VEDGVVGVEVCTVVTGVSKTVDGEKPDPFLASVFRVCVVRSIYPA
jgi:hypothetical protein